jgi:hypothetical protein
MATRKTPSTAPTTKKTAVKATRGGPLRRTISRTIDQITDAAAGGLNEAKKVVRQKADAARQQISAKVKQAEQRVKRAVVKAEKTLEADVKAVKQNAERRIGAARKAATQEVAAVRKAVSRKATPWRARSRMQGGAAVARRPRRPRPGCVRPPVPCASASRQFGTCTAGCASPRSWRTASMTLVMPPRLAGWLLHRPPPSVLTGSGRRRRSGCRRRRSARPRPWRRSPGPRAAAAP